MSIDLLNYWLLLPEVWISFGFFLLILELLIGTGYISLSLGIAAITLSLIISIQNHWELFLINGWMDLTLLFGVLSVTSIIVLKQFSKNHDDFEDINKY